MTLRLIHVLDATAAQVEASWVPSTLDHPAEVRSLIDAAWSAGLAVPGRTLFDGPMCRLERFDVVPAGVRIALSRTSYKAFWGTNMSHPELADSCGPAILANSIGLSPSLLTDDGWFLLGQRNDRVAYYPRRVHPFSGCLEPGDSPPPDVFNEVRRELSEELNLSPAHLSELRLAGLAEDGRLRQPELIFSATTTLSRARLESQLDPEEHQEVVAIAADPRQVERATLDGQLTPIAVATLLLGGRARFGDAWFHRLASTAANCQDVIP